MAMGSRFSQNVEQEIGMGYHHYLVLYSEIESTQELAERLNQGLNDPMRKYRKQQLDSLISISLRKEDPADDIAMKYLARDMSDSHLAGEEIAAME